MTEKTKLRRAPLKAVAAFTKKNAVMCIAFVAAVATGFIVPPDGEYLGYFDFKTLTCLFCVLAVVCALKNIHFFYILAEKIVELFKYVKHNPKRAWHYIGLFSLFNFGFLALLTGFMLALKAFLC